jgi:hypothetical protein
MPPSGGRQAPPMRSGSPATHRVAQPRQASIPTDYERFGTSPVLGEDGRERPKLHEDSCPSSRSVLISLVHFSLFTFHFSLFTLHFSQATSHWSRLTPHWQFSLLPFAFRLQPSASSLQPPVSGPWFSPSPFVLRAFLCPSSFCLVSGLKPQVCSSRLSPSAFGLQPPVCCFVLRTSHFVLLPALRTFNRSHRIGTGARWGRRATPRSSAGNRPGGAQNFLDYMIPYVVQFSRAVGPGKWDTVARHTEGPSRKRGHHKELGSIALGHRSDF